MRDGLVFLFSSPRAPLSSPSPQPPSHPHPPPHSNLRHNIMRVDFIRYVLMYRYGGVYSDLDVESLRPIEPLLEDARRAAVAGCSTGGLRDAGGDRPAACRDGMVAILGREGSSEIDADQGLGKGATIDISVMISSPGHPLWSMMIDHVVRADASALTQNDVFEITGNRLFTRVVSGFLRHRVWDEASVWVVGGNGGFGLAFAFYSLLISHALPLFLVQPRPSKLGSAAGHSELELARGWSLHY